MFILNVVKVVYFDRHSQVFILKGLTVLSRINLATALASGNPVWYLRSAKRDDYLTNDGHVCLFFRLLSGNERRSRVWWSVDKVLPDSYSR